MHKTLRPKHYKIDEKELYKQLNKNNIKLLQANESATVHSAKTPAECNSAFAKYTYNAQRP